MAEVSPGRLGVRYANRHGRPAHAFAVAEIVADRSLDGVNLLPPATGTYMTEPREIMHWLLSADGAVRRGERKYVRQGKHDFLFDLCAAPAEATDLRASQPEEFAELHALHEAWVKSLPPRLTELAKQASKAATMR